MAKSLRRNWFGLTVRMSELTCLEQQTGIADLTSLSSRSVEHAQQDTAYNDNGDERHDEDDG